jgi:hypothetical protein
VRARETEPSAAGLLLVPGETCAAAGVTPRPDDLSTEINGWAFPFSVAAEVSFEELAFEAEMATEVKANGRTAKNWRQVQVDMKRLPS